MKFSYIYIFIILISLLGCSNAPQNDTINLENKWKSLYEKEGCLTGGQHWGPGETEGSIFREKEWQNFFKLSPRSTIPFLMEKLESKQRTNIHVCPFDMATEGELAIYESEHILKSNWFECSSDYIELSKLVEKRKNVVSPLTTIIVENPKTRKEVKEYFLSKVQ